MPPAPIERVIAVDWSGARDARGVWLAEVRDGRCTRLGRTGTREAAVAAVLAAAGESPRVAAGLDFAFSYPAWFVAEQGCDDAPAFWRHVAARAEAWIADVRPPFWTLRTRGAGERGERAYRRTDREAAGARVRPKSVFQLEGPGQVGLGSLRGIPHLGALAGALAVWPFATPADDRGVAVEIYPRAFYGDAVRKNSAHARAAVLAPHAARVTPEHLALAAADDNAFDALVSALAMWDARAELAALPAARDGVERVEGRIWAAALGARPSASRD
jgi:hypothetical protein